MAVHMGYGGSRRCVGDGIARECTRTHAHVGGIQAIVTDNGQTQAFVAMQSACTVQWGILQSGHSCRGNSGRPLGSREDGFLPYSLSISTEPNMQKIPSLIQQKYLLL